MPLEEVNFRSSMKYFEVGIGAGLLYLVPFFVAHDQSASKFIFVLQQVIAIIVYAYFVFIASKLLKIKAPFKNLLTVMGYLWGFLFVLNFIISTPVLVAIGPNFLFQGHDDSWVYGIDRESLRIFVVVSTVLSFGFIALWLYLLLPWFSDAFGISKKKSLGALLIGGVPSGLIIAFVLGPLAKYSEHMLGNWLIAL
jgi:hypothetical protein